METCCFTPIIPEMLFYLIRSSNFGVGSQRITTFVGRKVSRWVYCSVSQLASGWVFLLLCNQWKRWRAENSYMLVFSNSKGKFRNWWNWFIYNIYYTSEKSNITGRRIIFVSLLKWKTWHIFDRLIRISILKYCYPPNSFPISKNEAWLSYYISTVKWEVLLFPAKPKSMFLPPILFWLYALRQK